jgi:hypothetical protein
MFAATGRRRPRSPPKYDSGLRQSNVRGEMVVARFHGGFLDGKLIADWATPPGSSVWIERVEDGVIALERPPDDPAADEAGPGYDHYVLAEVVADLAVYHASDA